MQKMRFAVFKYIEERNRGDKAPKAPQSPSSTRYFHILYIAEYSVRIIVGTHSTLYVQSTVVVRNNSVTKKI